MSTEGLLQTRLAREASTRELGASSYGTLPTAEKPPRLYLVSVRCVGVCRRAWGVCGCWTVCIFIDCCFMCGYRWHWRLTVLFVFVGTCRGHVRDVLASTRMFREEHGLQMADEAEASFCQQVALMVRGARRRWVLH
jgi:hypothetical protein